MTNQFYIRINYDLDLLKQFLSYIDKNTSIKWAGGEPVMHFSDRKIDGIFINGDRMKYSTNIDYVLEDQITYGSYKEITIDNLSVLNSKNLFYD